jgi:hypothetical protein
MKKRRGIRRKVQIRSSISNPTIKNDENIPFQSNSGFVRASLPTASIAAPIAIWGPNLFLCSHRRVLKNASVGSSPIKTPQPRASLLQRAAPAPSAMAVTWKATGHIKNDVC